MKWGYRTVSLLPAGPCTSQKSNSSVTLLDTSKVIWRKKERKNMRKAPELFTGSHQQSMHAKVLQQHWPQPPSLHDQSWRKETRTQSNYLLLIYPHKQQQFPPSRGRRRQGEQSELRNRLRFQEGDALCKKYKKWSWIRLCARAYSVLCFSTFL